MGPTYSCHASIWKAYWNHRTGNSQRSQDNIANETLVSWESAHWGKPDGRNPEVGMKSCLRNWTTGGGAKLRENVPGNWRSCLACGRGSLQAETSLSGLAGTTLVGGSRQCNVCDNVTLPRKHFLIESRSEQWQRGSIMSF